MTSMTHRAASASTPSQRKIKKCGNCQRSTCSGRCQNGRLAAMSGRGWRRCLALGLLNFQAVEAVKLMVIIYLAGYLARKAQLVQTRFFDTLKPLIFAGLLSVILLLQPDMGSAAVITAIVAGMVWLAGAAWRHIFVLGMLTLPAFGFAAMDV